MYRLELPVRRLQERRLASKALTSAGFSTAGARRFQSAAAGFLLASSRGFYAG